jgi:hypothetical protein
MGHLETAMVRANAIVHGQSYDASHQPIQSTYAPLLAATPPCSAPSEPSHSATPESSQTTLSTNSSIDTFDDDFDDELASGMLEFEARVSQMRQQASNCVSSV